MFKLHCNISSFYHILDMKFGHVEIENYFEAQEFYAHQQTNHKIDT